MRLPFLPPALPLSVSLFTLSSTAILPVACSRLLSLHLTTNCIFQALFHLKWFRGSTDKVWKSASALVCHEGSKHEQGCKKSGPTAASFLFSILGLIESGTATHHLLLVVDHSLTRFPSPTLLFSFLRSFNQKYPTGPKPTARSSLRH